MFQLSSPRGERRGPSTLFMCFEESPRFHWPVDLGTAARKADSYTDSYTSYLKYMQSELLVSLIYPNLAFCVKNCLEIEVSKSLNDLSCCSPTCGIVSQIPFMSLMSSDS